jgi:hypothetical protein
MADLRGVEIWCREPWQLTRASGSCQVRATRFHTRFHGAHRIELGPVRLDDLDRQFEVELRIALGGKQIPYGMGLRGNGGKRRIVEAGCLDETRGEIRAGGKSAEGKMPGRAPFGSGVEPILPGGDRCAEVTAAKWSRQSGCRGELRGSLAPGRSVNRRLHLEALAETDCACGK